MKNTTACAGCRNDFYNGNNPLGVQRCWSVESASIIPRFRLSVNTPMDRKSGYEKLKRPNCYRQDGFVFLEAIPNYAK